MKMKEVNPYRRHLNEIISLFRKFTPKHNPLVVFSDFCHIAAISMHNALPSLYSERRETAYLKTVGHYTKDELDSFVQILTHLTFALEYNITDVLGEVFHVLELHNKWAGQFFTPFPIAKFMAECLLVEVKEKIKEKGYISMSEPACGSGVMIIAAADTMRTQGINYQDHLFAECKDIDPRCVHMCYIQLSLLGVPAVVIQGNGLTEERLSTWYTPMYVMNGWQIPERKLSFVKNNEKRKSA